MKYYGNKSNGKLVHVKKMYGTKNQIVQFGYDDFLGSNQYNIQQYFVLRRKENDEYVFCKTVSEGKTRALITMGWELIKVKGTNLVAEEFMDSSILIIN
ncbi:hypothetical protein ACVNNN_24775 [Lysinibacillus fusiformis]|uniref:hypothetical protein n=1 Tax=Lysinibacillus sp. PWR01 TaxID=3342384 RepID=UPI00372D81CE